MTTRLLPPTLRLRPLVSIRLAAPLPLAALAFALLQLIPSAARAAYDPAEPIAPIEAPFPMPRLARPVFPELTIDIRDHGAVPGGQVKNTAAIAAAIAAASEKGGGHVLVPAGTWLTGPIHLRSHIDLHLAEGATLLFSDTMEDYLPVVLVRSGGIDLYNYSPLIYARDCEDIAITGPGKLDGNGRAWWDWKSKETHEGFELAARGVPVDQRVFGTREAAIRPNFLVPYNCRNVLLEGFTIGSGPCWTIQPTYCENVIIRRVTIDTDGPNNDGIDPDSCRNVLVEYCNFATGDDCLVLKSGYDADGRRVDRPTENVVMRHCFSARGHGGLVIGSEMSGSVRNVYMHDCEFDGTDRVLRIKSRPGRGGVVEKVWVENVKAKNLQREVVILNMDYSSDPHAITDTHAPVFRDIHVRRLLADGARVAIRITGMDTSPISGITFDDLKIKSDRGVVADWARDLTFNRVAIAARSGPLFQLDHVDDVTVDGKPLQARR